MANGRPLFQSYACFQRFSQQEHVEVSPLGHAHKVVVRTAAESASLLVSEVHIGDDALNNRFNAERQQSQGSNRNAATARLVSWKLSLVQQ